MLRAFSLAEVGLVTSVISELPGQHWSVVNVLFYRPIQQQLKGVSGEVCVDVGLVTWHSGKNLGLGQQTFPVTRSTFS